jgi:hypothetical protein
MYLTNIGTLDGVKGTKIGKVTDDLSKTLGVQTYEEMKQHIADRRKKRSVEQHSGDLPHPDDQYKVTIKREL